MKINTVKYAIDGNQVCAVFDDFSNLQESPAGFGDSLKEAFLDLMRQPETGVVKCKEWEKAWFNLWLKKEGYLG